ncbi:transposase [Flavobacterium sp. UGB4466]|uniref:transposase n=1 Tax=Flavobacterium sp. UGB4466 TaxID=2730889 RepID=UPI00192B636B
MERKIKYNYEFKLRCVNEVLNRQRSVNSVANENNFPDNLLQQINQLALIRH